MIDRHCTREVVELRLALLEQQDAALGRSPHSATAPSRWATAQACCIPLQGDEALVITGNGIRPDSVLVRRGTLEDVFLTLTGRTLDE